MFPSLVNVPSEFLHLGSQRGGRITTLVVLSSALLWVVVFWERAKANRLRLNHDRLVRQLAIRDFLARHAEPQPTAALWVIIPVLNEAENLDVLLPRIPRAVASRPVVVLVVDDGSTDDSAAVARHHGALVAELPMNCGGGTALRTGFDLASREGAGIVVTMDGDGQHDPGHIDRLVRPIVEDRADIVIGSRLLGSYEHISTARSAGLYLFNAAINLLMGTRISDCSSGFRAVRTSALQKLMLVQDQYHTAEFIIEAAKHGMRLTEEPITIVNRLSGTSKKGRDLLYGAFFLRTILKSWLR
jgi:glycosyltransferase involved in cell wall biosynthesis